MSHYEDEREMSHIADNKTINEPHMAQYESYLDKKEAMEKKYEAMLNWPTEDRIDVIAQNGNDGEHYANKYDKKLRKTSLIIDVYDVLDAFDVTNPAIAHAVKKMLMAGSRGYKDWEQDLNEAIASLEQAKKYPSVPF